MRSGVVAAVLAGLVLLVAALVGVESAATHLRSAKRARVAAPAAFIGELPETLPSATEVEDAEGLASPTFTR